MVKPILIVKVTGDRRQPKQDVVSGALDEIKKEYHVLIVQVHGDDFNILFEVLNGIYKNHPKLNETAKHISITERRAVEAERASRKFFQAQFLKDKIGLVFMGTITGLTDWGMFVELNENFCEGMISLKSMNSILPWKNSFFACGSVVSIRYSS